MTNDARRVFDVLRRMHEEPLKAFFVRVNDGRAVKRPIVIDVQNLAHKSAPGRKKRDYGGVFDLIRLCIERGHVVYAYTPLGHVRVSDDVRNADLLQFLINIGLVETTHTRRPIDGEHCESNYDDLHTIYIATRRGGVVISDDKFVDVKAKCAAHFPEQCDEAFDTICELWQPVLQTDPHYNVIARKQLTEYGKRQLLRIIEVAYALHCEGQLKQPMRGVSQSRPCTDSNDNTCEGYAKFERWQHQVKRAYHATEYDEEGEEPLANEMEEKLSSDNGSESAKEQSVGREGIGQDESDLENKTLLERLQRRGHRVAVDSDDERDDIEFAVRTSMGEYDMTDKGEQLLIDVDLSQPDLLLHTVDNDTQAHADMYANMQQVEGLRIDEDGLITPVDLKPLRVDEDDLMVPSDTEPPRAAEKTTTRRVEQTLLIDDAAQPSVETNHIEQERHRSELDGVDPVEKWRVVQAERLKKKDAEEARLLARWRAEAVEKLAAMKSAHKALVEKNKVKNREAEARFISKRDETTESSKQWEKIVQLCEFNHKPEKGMKDPARMRAILLEKKNEAN